jgi:hypothetical protein
MPQAKIRAMLTGVEDDLGPPNSNQCVRAGSPRTMLCVFDSDWTSRRERMQRRGAGGIGD